MSPFLSLHVSKIPWAFARFHPHRHDPPRLLPFWLRRSCRSEVEDDLAVVVETMEFDIEFIYPSIHPYFPASSSSSLFSPALLFCVSSILSPSSSSISHHILSLQSRSCSIDQMLLLWPHSPSPTLSSTTLNEPPLVGFSSLKPLVSLTLLKGTLTLPVFGLMSKLKLGSPLYRLSMTKEPFSSSRSGMLAGYLIQLTNQVDAHLELAVVADKGKTLGTVFETVECQKMDEEK